MKFISSMLYYHVLNYYFQWNAKEEMRVSIEENIIANIPSIFILDVLDFALDEAFAGSFNDFHKKVFNGNKGEIAIQLRLLNFLIKKEII